MIDTAAVNLIPGDEVELDSEMWRLIQHSVATGNPHPVKMYFTSLGGDPRSRTVVTSLTRIYRRTVRDCEFGSLNVTTEGKPINRI